jgi:hypothetical protein
VTAASHQPDRHAERPYLDPTSNPDTCTRSAASHQPYIDQFNGQILPGITSAFEGSGRTGSGRIRTRSTAP